MTAVRGLDRPRASHDSTNRPTSILNRSWQRRAICQRLGMALLIIAVAFPMVSQDSRPQLAELPNVDPSALDATVAAQLQGLERAVQEIETDRLGGRPKDLAEAYGRLAMALHAYELFGHARAAYGNAMSLAPDDRRWIYGTARVESREGNLQAAAKAYRQVLALSPDHLAARVHLGETLLALGELSEAEVVLESLEKSAEHPSILAARGQLALAQHQPARAAELLERVLQLLPEATLLHYPLGIAYRELGDTERSRRHLASRGPIGVKPPDPFAEDLKSFQEGERVLLLRGRKAFQVKRFREAAQAFRRAAAADPTSVRALVNLAAALSALGQDDDAEVELIKALKLDPQNLAGHFNLGSVQLARGDYASAAEHLSRVAIASPEDVAAHLALARATRGLGRSADALMLAERAVQMDSGSVEAIFQMATLLVDLERYADAKEALHRAYSLNPNDTRVIYGLARLLAASPEPELREPQRAYGLASDLFETQPSFSSAELLAQALSGLGRCAEAAQALEKAATLDAPDSPARYLERAAEIRYTGRCDL